MLVAVEDVVDESIDDGRLADCLVSEEDDLVLQQWRDGPLREI